MKHKYLLKIFEFILFSLLLLGIFPYQANAQATTTKESSDYYEIEVIVGDQSAWTNTVPITVHFKPKIDSLKTDVSWDAPIGVTINDNYTNYFPTKAGQVYTVTADLTPSKAGTFDIATNITAWNTDSNYISSKKTTITFNQALVVTPIQPGYAFSFGLKIFIYILAIGVIGFLIVIGLKRGSVGLQKWLKPPEF